MADGHGGHRENSGRKNAAYEAATGDAAILFAKSRAKEKAHKAKIAELQELKTKRELLDAKDVQRQADRAGRLVRDTFIAFPDRVASLLVGRDEAAILKELRKEIRATLKGLSNEIAEDN